MMTVPLLAISHRLQGNSEFVEVETVEYHNESILFLSAAYIIEETKSNQFPSIGNLYCNPENPCLRPLL
jgi:hypothetical protein